MPQAEAHAPVEQDERRLLVAASRLLEDRVPGVLGVLEDDPDELRLGVVGRREPLGDLLLLRLRRCELLHHAEEAQQLTGVGAGQQGDDHHDEDADAPEARPPAPGHTHPSTVLDVVALLTTLPAHGCLRLSGTGLEDRPSGANRWGSYNGVSPELSPRAAASWTGDEGSCHPEELSPGRATRGPQSQRWPSPQSPPESPLSGGPSQGSAAGFPGGRGAPATAGAPAARSIRAAQVGQRGSGVRESGSPTGQSGQSCRLTLPGKADSLPGVRATPCARGGWNDLAQLLLEPPPLPGHDARRRRRPRPGAARSPRPQRSGRTTASASVSSAPGGAPAT